MAEPPRKTRPDIRTGSESRIPSASYLFRRFASDFPFRNSRGSGRLPPRMTIAMVFTFRGRCCIHPLRRVVTSRKCSSGNVFAYSIPVRDTFTYAVGSRMAGCLKCGRFRPNRPRSWYPESYLSQKDVDDLRARKLVGKAEIVPEVTFALRVATGNFSAARPAGLSRRVACRPGREVCNLSAEPSVRTGAAVVSASPVRRSAAAT